MRFHAALGLLALAVSSPLDYWAGRYFFDHMIEHVVLMFYVPLLVVRGAPWMCFVHALPVKARRRVLRWLFLSVPGTRLRTVARVATGPCSAVVAFNLAMVLWHLPGPFDLAESNQWVHVGLMHSSFLLTGVAFWLQVIPSPPFRPRLGPMGRLAALTATSLTMWIMAMALGLFSRASWYRVYAHVPGVHLAPLADQQIGAGILWVCGDLWAVPALVAVMATLIKGTEANVGFTPVMARIMAWDRPTPTPAGDASASFH